MINKLIYLAYKIKLNIIFAIKKLSKYNTNLKKDYFWTAKKIVKYLKRIMQIKLIFGQGLNSHWLKDLLLYGLTNYINNTFAKYPKIKNW